MQRKDDPGAGRLSRFNVTENRMLTFRIINEVGTAWAAVLEMGTHEGNEKTERDLRGELTLTPFMRFNQLAGDAMVRASEIVAMFAQRYGLSNNEQIELSYGPLEPVPDLPFWANASDRASMGLAHVFLRSGSGWIMPRWSGNHGALLNRIEGEQDRTAVKTVCDFCSDGRYIMESDDILAEKTPLAREKFQPVEALVADRIQIYGDPVPPSESMRGQPTRSSLGKKWKGLFFKLELGEASSTEIARRDVSREWTRALAAH